ncbi:hypothetical protein HC352_08800 [Arcanobacterium buesumense]|uniref:DUF4825 domain-containing protein n=2 Tax=Arcanobacterium buesumense TaxID=2722751 RepID=A0A6H2END8_9ACTO|nr:hypothetical protein HC352_08800 [Arcanobacterium buesumense]
MRVGISHWRTIISALIVIIIVSAGFWGVYRLVVSNQLRISYDGESLLTYRTHNISDSLIYASDYVGDQGNTFSLMKTLPLNEKITQIGIIDQGVVINLHEINLNEDSIQRDILYSASVVMATIKDAKYVAYQSNLARIEVTRYDVESFIPEGALTTLNQQKWDQVRRSIPEAVPQIIAVRKLPTAFKEPSS